jgi:ABC-type polysaccharide/polyol phosphate transport system ATPase subunit
VNLLQSQLLNYRRTRSYTVKIPLTFRCNPFPMSDIVLDVRHLHVQFQTDETQIIAVDGIDFQLSRGQTLGIVVRESP